MAKRFKKLPSEILRIDDEYTAFCLDEACCYIMGELDAGNEMSFIKHYSTFSELYSKYQ